VNAGPEIDQALSVFDALVPQEIAEPYTEALSKLQSCGPAMPKRRSPRAGNPDSPCRE
jgi:hypothetical protein